MQEIHDAWLETAKRHGHSEEWAKEKAEKHIAQLGAAKPTKPFKLKELFSSPTPAAPSPPDLTEHHARLAEALAKHIEHQTAINERLSRIPPPVVTPAPSVEVSPPVVHVSPPTVEVSPPVVNVAPPVIEAPVVHVAAPVVNVEAPDLKGIRSRLNWILFFLGLIAGLLLFTGRAHAQFSHINSIQIDSGGTQISGGFFTYPFVLNYTGAGCTPTASGNIVTINCSAGGGGDTITSPNSTLTVGGTSSATTLDVTGSAGKILAGATPALTFTPTLGISGTAGTLSLFPTTGNFTTTLGSAATASNTVKFFATAPVTGDLIDCVTASTTCTLTDAGVLAANVVTNGGTNLTTNTIPKANGTTSLTNSSLSDNGTTVSTAENLSIGTASSTASIGMNTTGGNNTLTTQSGANGITWTLPSTTGTFADSVSAPLALNTTTGNLTITGAAGQVLAGATPAFTATPTLGASGTLGSLTFGNATSGLLTLQTATGAITSYTIDLPVAQPTSGNTFLSCTAAATAVCTWVAGGSGTTTNALTMNNSGSGAASGATFNGASAVTLSYNTIGASVANPPLDKSATGLSNPTADATFTYPAASTSGFTFAGTQPATQSSGAGTAATTLFNVNGVAGGQASATTGVTGGTGSSPTVASGAGGAVTGATGVNIGGAGGTVTLSTGNGGAATSGVGGAGGNIALTTGTGGTSSGSNNNPSGGNVVVTVGQPGTAGTGTAGSFGQFQLTGTALSSSSGAGQSVGTVFNVLGITGQATTSATVVTAGNGSAVSIASGTGGAGGGGATSATTGGTGGTITLASGAGGAGTANNDIGGAGGAVAITAGNGGNSSGTGVNSNGGTITVTPGSAGTGGSGTAGKAGVLALSGVGAGFNYFTQGTAITTSNTNVPANSIIEQAPTAVTAYVLTKPTAAPTNNFSAKTTTTAGVESFNKMQQYAVSTGSYTNATTTVSNVTGLSFSVDASTNYGMVCHLYWQGSATTAGLKATITGPSSPTAVNIGFHQILTASTYNDVVATSFGGTGLGVTTAITATTNFESLLTMGLQNGTNAGTVQVQLAAQGTGTVTLQNGSYCVMQ